MIGSLIDGLVAKTANFVMEKAKLKTLKIKHAMKTYGSILKTDFVGKQREIRMPAAEQRKMVSPIKKPRMWSVSIKATTNPTNPINNLY